MSHLVYARKYRPKDFDELIDQEHIATTLKNAITQNNLAHAYLFAGPRGIGKTSTARILAKALNCKKGLSAKPCNKCIACKEISEGRSLDVLEIDGASNRGIDEIRTLRENVKFVPSSSRFKIYIIDEVHMLTTEAFNALLKTLEEPPSYVKFVFATTEPHKVLATILSRCQRFDFHKISVSGIIVKLKKLCLQEHIKCEEQALYAIAKNADGSLRDAEVVIDQMNSFSKGKITLDSVNSVLGLVSTDVIFSLIGQLDAQNIAKNLVLLDTLIKQGKEPAQLLLSLIAYFRDMMLIKCGCTKLVTSPKEDMVRTKKLSEKFSIENILYDIAVLSFALERMKRQSSGRLLLEMAIVKLSKQEEILPAGALLEKLHKIEEKLQRISKASSSAGNKATSSTPKSRSNSTPTHGYTEKLSSSEPSAQVTNNKAQPFESNSEQKQDTAELKTDIAVEPELRLDYISKIWPQVIKELRKKKMSLGIYLSEGRLLNVHKNIIEVGFLDEYEFHRENLIESNNLKMIEGVVEKVIDQKAKLNLINCKKFPEQAPTDSSPEDSTIEEPEFIEGEDIDDFIQSAMDVFNGRIIHREE